MWNSSQVTFFVLSGYWDIGVFRYVAFLFLMVLYVMIVCSNVFLIAIICMNRTFHKPMYLFLCSLFLNQLYGSLGLFPLLLVQVLSQVHTVPVHLCFLQIFCLYSYACVEFLNLSVMSYDRYAAICCPLQYRTRMNTTRIAVLILLSWLYGCGVCVVMISLSAPMRLCGNIINKVYCDNYLIVKLACFDTRVNNINGLVNTVAIVFCPLALSLFSYIKILQVCFSGSKQTRQKALVTCTPHLASLANFTFGAFFEIVQSRFNMSRVPVTVRVILSLYWLTCQPLFNPLIYGLKLSSIRNVARALLVLKV